jgi:hypothetical protein
MEGLAAGPILDFGLCEGREALMLLEVLELYAMGILKPDRVVISIDPVNAVRPSKAQRKGVDYDTIFVRRDGWAVACRREWRGKTYLLWPQEWDAVITLGNQCVRRLNGSGAGR